MPPRRKRIHRPEPPERMSLETFLRGRFCLAIDPEGRFSRNHEADPSAADLSGEEVLRRMYERTKPSIYLFEGVGTVPCMQPSRDALERVARALLGDAYDEAQPLFSACLAQRHCLPIENGRLAFATQPGTVDTRPSSPLLSAAS